MSPDDFVGREKGPPLDFSSFVRDYFPSGGLLGMNLVDVSQSGRSLCVVFDGVPEIRSGRFGVHIETPAEVGDERWNEFPVTANDLQEWTSMAVILDLVEVYDTTARSTETPPDADGVIWLS